MIISLTPSLPLTNSPSHLLPQPSLLISLSSPKALLLESLPLTLHPSYLTRHPSCLQKVISVSLGISLKSTIFFSLNFKKFKIISLKFCVSLNFKMLFRSHPSYSSWKSPVEAITIYFLHAVLSQMKRK